MDRINALLMKARKIARSGGIKLIIGIVKYDENLGRFALSGTLWDGVEGSGGEQFYSEHSTKQEAIDACESYAEQYPGADILTLSIESG